MNLVERVFERHRFAAVAASNSSDDGIEHAGNLDCLHRLFVSELDALKTWLQPAADELSQLLPWSTGSSRKNLFERRSLIEPSRLVDQKHLGPVPSIMCCGASNAITVRRPSR